jgi:tetratricopeptide (TPR) repeat protein
VCIWNIFINWEEEMRKIIIPLFFALSASIFAQTDEEVLQLSEKLISEKQYLTAFQKLDDYDSENTKPDIVLAKEKIVLNYFITSLMHQMFVLKNLKMNETVMDYRGKEGQYTFFSFPVNKILDTLINRYPENYRLYNGLAEFYYEVHLKYGDNWLISTPELLKLMEKNYLVAIKHDAGDYLSYYVLGYVKILNREYDQCIDFFKKSIALKYDYPSSHYNLAYAYLYLDKRDSAISEAEISAKQYEDEIYKADAYRLIGITYSELNDMQNAIKYLELSNKFDPDNYYTLKLLLKASISTNSKRKDDLLNSFFKLNPDNPTIYNDLSEIYGYANKYFELEKFYQSKLSEYRNNDEVSGNLYFYLGQIYFESDKKKAIEYINTAREFFKRVYPEEHQVFKMIDEILEKN